MISPPKFVMIEMKRFDEIHYAVRLIDRNNGSVLDCDNFEQDFILTFEDIQNRVNAFKQSLEAHGVV